MLFDYIRILKKVGATRTDISYENQDDSAKSEIPLESTDHVLIGMQYPFNNFFVNLTASEPNDAVSALSLEYWNGNAWKSVVDLIDGTSVGGKTFAKSGHVLFALDKHEAGWLKVNDPETDGPDELDGTNIYDLYWLRLKVSAELVAADPADNVSFEEIGFAWTTGQKMKAIKSEIDRYLPSFATGKTNWIPEIMLACKMMTTDLKKAGLVLGPQQVLRVDDFWLPATYKTLWLIYSNLGPAYLESANAMAHQFYKTMNVDNISVDQDLNGRQSDWEKDSRVRTGVR